MWLTRTDRPPRRDPHGGWKLSMIAAHKPLTIRITDEAVREIAQPSASANAFYENRLLFEEIADRKYERQEFEPDGSIKVEPSDFLSH